ncbi:GNAT family N-acetyltransferase [Microbacterium gorillae]|uniref:GNAT family N-acetyltransferase n=1 Tax=Microbacterium gorillae TaxID=1231063 RepID=UPI00058D1315|nr:GNAT family protein [Microbacterium gorillae]
MTASSDPLTAIAWPLRTPRLTIRRARPADDAVVWTYRSDPVVSRWLGAAPESAEAFSTYFHAPHRLATTLIIELAGAQPVVIGDLMLKVEDEWAQAEVAAAASGTGAELGWVLDPAYAGRGYATEAVRAMIDAAFTQAGLRRVHAGCFAENTPSWRVMERLGMRREEHSRRTALHRSGVWMDGMNYALLADEWGTGGPTVPAG